MTVYCPYYAHGYEPPVMLCVCASRERAESALAEEQRIAKRNDPEGYKPDEWGISVREVLQ